VSSRLQRRQRQGEVLDQLDRLGIDLVILAAWRAA
jgi:folate-dependent phosphoribosylglycinamide formyltransferase PurN